MQTKQVSRNFKFMLFTILYFVQGVIAAYQLNFFKPHLDSAGIAPNLIGLAASLAFIPFILKFLFGFVSDKVNLFGRGHRVPYMMLGVVICSSAFLIAFFVDPASNFRVLAATIILATFGMSMFDTVADAYAIEVTPEEDHSRVQSFMTSGRAIGLVILSFLFGIIASRYGYNAIFLVISILLLFPLVMLFRTPEPDLIEAGKRFDWSAFRALLQPQNLLLSLQLLVAYYIFTGIDGLVALYASKLLGDADGALQTLGNIGTIKGVGMILGAIAASWIVLRYGKRTAGLLTLILVTIGGLLFSQFATVPSIMVISFFWGIASGLHWAVYAVIIMGSVDIRIAASMVALYQMMINIGFALGELTMINFATALGFPSLFMTLGFANLLLIPLFLYIVKNMKSGIQETA